ncbi:MAG: hypothetical protein EHM35_02530 [Planctomycetaceae bacterium]|nr:MAG: hypothetical protein EHM35_02530 [Planctomycetaceae bacterium]
MLFEPDPGDGEITIPTDNEGAEKFRQVLSDIVGSPYFWTVVTIFIVAAIASYVWKNYPIVRYVTIFIAGVVASGYGLFAIFKQ